MQWTFAASRIRSALPTTEGVDQYKPGTLFEVTSLKSSATSITDVSPETSNPDYLDEPVLFNCTGLGAGKLFGDTEITPAKGQLVYMPPDPAVDYLTIGGGSDLLYMFSRSDVLLLGGTFKVGDYTTNPEPEETARMVAGHQRIFSGFA